MCWVGVDIPGVQTDQRCVFSASQHQKYHNAVMPFKCYKSIEQEAMVIHVWVPSPGCAVSIKTSHGSTETYPRKTGRYEMFYN